MARPSISIPIRYSKGCTKLIQARRADCSVSSTIRRKSIRCDKTRPAAQEVAKRASDSRLAPSLRPVKPTIGRNVHLMRFDHTQTSFLWLFYHTSLTDRRQPIDSNGINIILEGLKDAIITLV